MATTLKPGWSKPSTILFASEIPANEKAFAFALAQASEFGADLILFHAYDTLVVAASETSGIRYYDYAAAARAEMKHLEPLAERARAAGLRCEVVVRPGLAADQILAYTPGTGNRSHRDGHPLVRGRSANCWSGRLRKQCCEPRLFRCASWALMWSMEATAISPPKPFFAPSA